MNPLLHFMASSMEKPLYAAVTEGSVTAINEISETEEQEADSLEISAEMIHEGKKYIKKEAGRIVVQPPVDVLEDIDKRTVICRYKNMKSGWIDNPPLNVVIKIFGKILEYFTYYYRGLKFRILEFRFGEGEHSRLWVYMPIIDEEWSFLPLYMEKRCVQIKTGGVSIPSGGRFIFIYSR